VVGDFDGRSGDSTGLFRGRTIFYRNDLGGGVASASVTLPDQRPD
jgi:hypothetical protein